MKSRSVVVYIAASLDGYIATKEESLDWLDSVDGEGDNGYAEFYETIDTILMGRVTYDWLIKNVGDEFPYKEKPCYVFSRKKENPVDSNVTFVQADLISFLDELKAKEGKKIWLVGGGELLQSFLMENLVDEIILTIAPRIIGEGIPLFPSARIQKNLVLQEIRQRNQFVELRYEVLKEI